MEDNSNKTELNNSDDIAQDGLSTQPFISLHLDNFFEMSCELEQPELSTQHFSDVDNDCIIELNDNLSSQKLPIRSLKKYYNDNITKLGSNFVKQELSAQPFTSMHKDSLIELNNNLPQQEVLIHLLGSNQINPLAELNDDVVQSISTQPRFLDTCNFKATSSFLSDAAPVHPRITYNSTLTKEDLEEFRKLEEESILIEQARLLHNNKHNLIWDSDISYEEDRGFDEKKVKFGDTDNKLKVYNTLKDNKDTPRIFKLLTPDVTWIEHLNQRLFYEYKHNKMTILELSRKYGMSIPIIYNIITNLSKGDSVDKPPIHDRVKGNRDLQNTATVFSELEPNVAWVKNRTQQIIKEYKCNKMTILALCKKYNADIHTIYDLIKKYEANSEIFEIRTNSTLSYQNTMQHISTNPVNEIFNNTGTNIEFDKNIKQTYASTNIYPVERTSYVDKIVNNSLSNSKPTYSEESLSQSNKTELIPFYRRRKQSISSEQKNRTSHDVNSKNNYKLDMQPMYNLTKDKELFNHNVKLNGKRKGDPYSKQTLMEQIVAEYNHKVDVVINKLSDKYKLSAPIIQNLVKSSNAISPISKPTTNLMKAGVDLDRYQIAQLLDEYKNNKATVMQLSHKYKVSISIVYNLIKQYKLNQLERTPHLNIIRNNDVSKSTVRSKVLEEYKRNGYNGLDLCQKFNLTVQAVTDIIKDIQIN